MKRKTSGLCCFLLLAALLLSLTACGKTADTPLEKTAQYLQEQVTEPVSGAIAGD